MQYIAARSKVVSASGVLQASKTQSWMPLKKLASLQRHSRFGRPSGYGGQFILYACSNMFLMHICFGFWYAISKVA